MEIQQSHFSGCHLEQTIFIAHLFAYWHGMFIMNIKWHLTKIWQLDFGCAVRDSTV